MSLARIEDRMACHHLGVMGALHLDEGEVPGHATLVLLGPAGPKFWDHFTGCSEYRDERPDPMDRWSTRVITEAAQDLGAGRSFLLADRPGSPSSTGRGAAGGPGRRPWVCWCMTRRG